MIWWGLISRAHRLFCFTISHYGFTNISQNNFVLSSIAIIHQQAYSQALLTRMTLLWLCSCPIFIYFESLPYYLLKISLSSLWCQIKYLGIPLYKLLLISLFYPEDFVLKVRFYHCLHISPILLTQNKTISSSLYAFPTSYIASLLIVCRHEFIDTL